MVEELGKILTVARDLVSVTVGILTIAVLAKQLREKNKTKRKTKSKRKR
jgi:hypothetical protein